jgi:hypothetical protein
LKKIVTIFFLVVFAALQYGKAFSFLHCKVYSYYVKGEKNCDCEKQLWADPADDTDNGNQHPLIAKEKLEEPFLNTIDTPSCSAGDILLSANWRSFEVAQPPGWHADCFHPPCS